MSWHVETIRNQYGSHVILLREAWREGKRIRKKTIANLTKLPPEIVEGIRTLLRGGVAVDSLEEVFTIRRSLPHGHAAAVVGIARKLGLPRLLHSKRSRQRDIALATICDRLISPRSKLATSRHLSPATANSTLGHLFNLGEVKGNEVLNMLDWLLAAQKRVENKLAKRHLKQGGVLLFDLSSSYFEGHKCSIGKYGKNRDGKRGKEQINYALVCAPDGCPVSVQVFPGNTGDPRALTALARSMRNRFGIDSVAVVGDRGMITSKRIRDDLTPLGLDWITALKKNQIRTLLKVPEKEAEPGEKVEKKPPLCPETLVPDEVNEITAPSYPRERLMACLNPRLQNEQRRKREELLLATEKELQEIHRLVENGTLDTKEKIDRRLGSEVNKMKVAKHLTITTTEKSLSWKRNTDKIREEARLDGIYVIRTSLKTDAISGNQTVKTYKSLTMVERAFRTEKSTLRIRPIYLYDEDHVRAHVFLCMLAYYIQWHMRERLAPMLFVDQDPEGAFAKRKSPVDKARPSDSAKAKTDSKKTPDGMPVHSFETLLEDLSTLNLNQVSLQVKSDNTIPITTKPTALQSKAFELLGVDPGKMYP